MFRSDETRPRCKEPTEHESVDVGIGIMHGPEYCSACGWSEYGDAGKVIDGYYHDITGSAYPVESADARVEALKKSIAERFADSRAKTTLELGSPMGRLWPAGCIRVFL